MAAGHIMKSEVERRTIEKFGKALADYLGNEKIKSDWVRFNEAIDREVENGLSEKDALKKISDTWVINI